MIGVMNNLQPPRGSLRLAHGWRLTGGTELPAEIIRDFIRPAVRAVPRALAARFKHCRIALPRRLTNAALSSQWVQTNDGFDIEVASEKIDGHELALELLQCLGQALWEVALAAEREAYLKLLDAEIGAGVLGEIDKESLREKQVVLSNLASARSRMRVERYAAASFAGTVAEYIHSLWHDVTVRTGPEHLPAPWLRRRLELFARWFPPDRGHRLFARRP